MLCLVNETDFSYDSDGNVTRKTDARSIYINYGYDALHRVTQKSYSNGDPTQWYTYDVNPGSWGLALQNYVGRLTRVINGTSTVTTFFSYDVMGRVVWQPSCLPSNCGATRDNIVAGYDLAGSLTSLTYPSNRKVTYAYDAAGRPLSAIDTTNGVNYALNAQYAPQGALSSLSHVSTAAGGLLETRTYTPRLQPDLLQAGVNGGAFVLNLDYNFTEPATGKNNGNVYQVANLRNTNRTTDYTYDSLNRIKTATTLGPDWGQSFAIDPWGNLTAQAVTKGTAPAFSATALASNRLSGFSYDAAGNMLGDGQHTYVYNAESQVSSLDSGATAYVYDASGMRVRKTTGTNWTEYLYWGSDPVAERDQTGAWTEYVFFGGKRTARRESSGTVYYYFSDHLGSASVVTDAAGVIKEESDYFPYGGERVLTDLLPKQNYKFTGKERDTESGLDYFGARYYSSRMGRWLTPDDPFYDQHLEDPQSWNLFGYVLNNPTGHIDPDGKGTFTLLFKAAKAVAKGESVRQTFAAVKDQVKTALDSSKPLADRIEAAGGALSEVVLPVSFQDARDAGDAAGELVSEVDDAGGVAALAVKTYQTYTKENPETGEVYSGRTSGTGKPEENVKKRDSSHQKNKEGFGPAKLDKSSKSSDANRGREQVLHENFKAQGKSANKINPISPKNPNKSKFMKKAFNLFRK